MAVTLPTLEADQSPWGDVPGIAAADVDKVAAYFQRETIRCIADPVARAEALRTLAEAWWTAVTGEGEADARLDGDGRGTERDRAPPPEQPSRAVEPT